MSLAGSHSHLSHSSQVAAPHKPRFRQLPHFPRNPLQPHTRNGTRPAHSEKMLSAQQESRLIGYLDQAFLRHTSQSNKLTKLPLLDEHLTKASPSHAPRTVEHLTDGFLTARGHNQLPAINSRDRIVNPHCLSPPTHRPLTPNSRQLLSSISCRAAFRLSRSSGR